LPQALEDAGGWPNRDTASRFADYVAVVARALGDRVSDWMLFNEPLAFTYRGYLEGTHAPGRQSLFAFLRASHTVNLAQGAGFNALKAARPSARVGTAFSMSPCEPATNSEEDRLAAERAHAITNVWFLEPALNGRYPEALAFLPDTAMGIRSSDLDKMKAPFDFIGINLYYRTIASAPSAMERFSHAQQWLFPVKMVGGEQGPKTSMGWEIWPQALYDMVMRITRDFNRPVIEISESGCAYNDGPDADGAILDTRRIEYHRQYLQALARAMADGADVRGYHAWSLMDNLSGRKASASASAWPTWTSRPSSGRSRNRDGGMRKWLRGMRCRRTWPVKPATQFRGLAISAASLVVRSALLGRPRSREVSCDRAARRAFSGTRDSPAKPAR
jgi:beta-glucosidase